MNLPKNAKRVFKGDIFEVYQWRQKMFDGSYKIFERAKRPDTVIIIATQKNKIIALRQRQPGTKWFYCTPSGRMDVPGETPKQAALRELLEETGMKPEKFFLWKRMPKNGKIASTIHFYIARGCKKVTEQKLDAGEKIKIELISFDRYLHLADQNYQHLEESVMDMLRARLEPKYKKHLKKLFFG